MYFEPSLSTQSVNNPYELKLPLLAADHSAIVKNLRILRKQTYMIFNIKKPDLLHYTMSQQTNISKISDRFFSVEKLELCAIFLGATRANPPLHNIIFKTTHPKPEQLIVAGALKLSVLIPNQHL